MSSFEKGWTGRIGSWAVVLAGIALAPQASAAEPQAEPQKAEPQKVAQAVPASVTEGGSPGGLGAASGAVTRAGAPSGRDGDGAERLGALERRLAQVEDQARSAEARATVAEERAGVLERKAGDAAPSAVGADEKGFVLRSPDNAYALKVKGLAAFDGRKYLDDPAVAQTGDGFIVRKIRPVFEATVIKFVDLRLVIDFAGSQVTVLDAFADVRPASWLKLRVGKFIAPVGLERSQQDPELAFVERSLTGNLSQARDVGLVAYGDIAGGLVHVAGGVVNGTADNALADLDTNQGKDVIGRVWFQPFKRPSLARFGALAVGLSGSYGDHRGQATPAGSALAPFRSAGQTAFFQYLSSATDATASVYADGTHRRINPQLFYYVGPVGLLSELSFSRHTVHRDATVTALDHRAWHATANYVLGGRPTLNGVVVGAPFDPGAGNFGALELAVRVGQLDIDPDTFPTFASPTASAQRARELAGGASWYPSRNLRVSANYEQTRFFAAANTVGFARRDEKVIFARTQVLF